MVSSSMATARAFANTVRSTPHTASRLPTSSATMSAITGIIQNMNTNNMPNDTDYAGPLIAMFALTDGPTELRDDAMHVLAAIASRRQLRMQLVQLGAIELLMAQLETGSSSTGDVIEALLQLALDKRSHARFYSSKSMPALLTYLRSASSTDALQVAQVITVVNCLLTTAPLRLQFIEHSGLSLMADYVISGAPTEREQAAFALWLLAAIPAVQPRFTSTKALTALVHSLECGSGDLLDTALSALVLLAENDQCRHALNADDVLSMLPSIVRQDGREEVRYRVDLLEELLMSQ